MEIQPLGCNFKLIFFNLKDSLLIFLSLIDTPISLDKKEFITKASTEGFEHLQLDIP